MKIISHVYLMAGIALISSWTARADLFTAGFETTDTPSYTAGQQLHNTGGGTYWNWSGADIGLVSADPAAVYTGSQGLDATRSTTANSQLWWTRPTAFSEITDGEVSISLAVRTTGWTSSQDSFLEIAASDVLVDDIGANGTRSGWLTLKGNGSLYAWNGSGSELQLASSLDLTTWQLLRMDINLVAGTYNVFLNNSQVGTELNFFGGAVDSIGSLQFKEYNNGQSSGGVYLDQIAISVVPEPTTFGLMAAVFMMLMARRRRGFAPVG